MQQQQTMQQNQALPNTQQQQMHKKAHLKSYSDVEEKAGELFDYYFSNEPPGMNSSKMTQSFVDSTQSPAYLGQIQARSPSPRNEHEGHNHPWIGETSNFFKDFDQDIFGGPQSLQRQPFSPSLSRYDELLPSWTLMNRIPSMPQHQYQQHCHPERHLNWENPPGTHHHPDQHMNAIYDMQPFASAGQVGYNYGLAPSGGSNLGGRYGGVGSISQLEHQMQKRQRSIENQIRRFEQQFNLPFSMQQSPLQYSSTVQQQSPMQQQQQQQQQLHSSTVQQQSPLQQQPQQQQQQQQKSQSPQMNQEPQHYYDQQLQTQQPAQETASKPKSSYQSESKQSHTVYTKDKQGKPQKKVFAQTKVNKNGDQVFVTKKSKLQNDGTMHSDVHHKVVDRKGNVLNDVVYTEKEAPKPIKFEGATIKDEMI